MDFAAVGEARNSPKKGDSMNFIKSFLAVGALLLAIAVLVVTILLLVKSFRAYEAGEFLKAVYLLLVAMFIAKK